MATNSVNALLTYKEIVGLYHDTKWCDIDITGEAWPYTLSISSYLMINEARWHEQGIPAGNEYIHAFEFYFVYYYQHHFSTPVFCLNCDIGIQGTGGQNYYYYVFPKDRHFLFQMIMADGIKDVNICTQLGYTLSGSSLTYNFILNTFSPINANYLRDAESCHLLWRCQLRELMNG